MAAAPGAAAPGTTWPGADAIVWFGAEIVGEPDWEIGGGGGGGARAAQLVGGVCVGWQKGDSRVILTCGGLAGGWRLRSGDDCSTIVYCF